MVRVGAGSVDHTSAAAGDHAVPEVRVGKLHENSGGLLRRDVRALSHRCCALRQSAAVDGEFMAHPQQV